MSLFGRYATELDMLLHGSTVEQYRNEKLIGMNDDEKSLQIHYNELCKRYINEQVRFYPTSMNFLQSYIIELGTLFNNVILNYGLP